MSSDFFIFKSDNVRQTRSLAKKLSKILKNGDRIALYGSLGAGKSEFARTIIKNLTPGKTNIPSPTFTLVQPYSTRLGTIYHIDLYRLNSASELYDIGIPDIFFQGISLIEWPQIAQVFLSSSTLNIYFKAQGEHEREIKLEVSNAWKERLAPLTKLPNLEVFYEK
ncbi:MAG: tRNA (adenosine(37)-N6)-threonylcarbamoyltransferase complex ATPase subunit type 1 TsaE [Holosporales bacterium]|jgi:tRNA threonylcarbamoyl adenosine modification protein YjeE|nr:tRNA (adenosine(37)-N6)-threonylcarbamoyltransferase complex ATPase subunit type 1 TsaE [Holosporales bacterium]